MFDARRAAAVLTLAVLTAGGADAAHAGTASGRPAQFTAAPGERNALTVDAGTGGGVQFSDAGAPIGLGLWCVPLPPGQALCDPDGDARVTDGGGVRVTLGDGDDRATVRWLPGTGVHPGTITVTGGAGDDRLEGSADGVLRFDGGDGDDALVTGTAADVQLLGGAGSDLMESTLVCCSIASYADHDGAGVRVTLDRTANDGGPGESDDVRTSGVLGSPGPDAITGDERANTLTGSGGRDLIEGGGGDDQIVATAYGVPDGPDTVRCGAGADQVVADPGDGAGVDCEAIRVGLTGGPELVLDMGTARASRAGSLAATYRVRFPNPDNAAASRSTFRLVDRLGRAASSTARFALGPTATVARLRVRLTRDARRRLARSRAGALALFAQRVSRDATAGSTSTGYDRFNTPVRIRRTR